MHYIKQHILDKLVFAEYLRNRDMRPPKVESNLYQYHLKELQKDGYVKKEEAGYTLSMKGLHYAGQHSTLLKKLRPQPTVMTIVFAENAKGEVLIRTKQRQPFIGMRTLLMGKMHLNETVLDQAQREYIEKTDPITPTATLVFSQFATVHMVITDGDYVITDYIGILVRVRVPDDTTAPNTAFIDPSSTIEALAPGVRELLDMYCNGDTFGEFSINMDKPS
jgi:glucan-binding YG repeat protein